MPSAVVTPTSSEMVSEILKFCNETKTPVLPYGSGYSFTGLSNRRAGLTVVLDMKKMNRLIGIDEGTLTVRAEAGIIVGDMADQVRERGYYVNTVALPYYQDTLGGMISGVVGGGYPLYSSQVGLNNKHIVGLKVVLPTGAIVETNVNNAPFHARDQFLGRDGAIHWGWGNLWNKDRGDPGNVPLPPFWKSGSFFFENFDAAYDALVKASSSEELRCEYLNLLGPELTEIYKPNWGDPRKFLSIVYYLHGFTERRSSLQNGAS